MNNRTLLFVANVDTPDAEITAVLEAGRDQNSRVVCLVLAMAPTIPISAYGALPYGTMDTPSGYVAEFERTKEILKTRGDQVENLLQKSGTSGDIHPVMCTLSDVHTNIVRRALICDLASVAENVRADEPHLFRVIVHALLFDSPAPLLLGGTPLASPQRIFVAWNAELPAARAIHAALPMLKSASEVIVGCFDPEAKEYLDGEDPGADLSGWLSHHGCKVTLNQYPSGGVDTGGAIKRRASEAQADLLVMGAYGRSRLRELIFGGTTKTLLEQSEIPVLMTH